MKCEKAPSSQALVDAMNVLVGRALYDGPEYKVAIRLAESDGAVWLDLADAEWSAIRVTRKGWSVVPSTEVPIRFRRRRGMLPLPVPVSGGQINELRKLVNLPDDDAWMLFVAFLVGALSPSGPYPILVVNGEQGSAKSTLCRFARNLIDPNQAPLRRPTRDDRDLIIAGSNGWIIGYDNLSRIPASMSDALCASATGSGFGTRDLFSAARPIMVNGITDLATRSDLLDRAVQLVLRPIPDERRRDEAALHAQFDAARPRLLGALLDAVCAAVRNRASVRLETMPRMADFAIWVTAAEPALGWEPGEFLRVYTADRARANDLALEASPVATAVPALLESVGERHGSATELLAALEVHIDEQTRKHKEWPKTPRGMRSAMDRAAPNLRVTGITVETGNRASTRNRTRIIGLKSSPTRPSEPSIPSESPSDDPWGGMLADSRADDPRIAGMTIVQRRTAIWLLQG